MFSDGDCNHFLFNFNVDWLVCLITLQWRVTNSIFGHALSGNRCSTYSVA